MTDLSTLKFFVTPSHTCSYLEQQKASTLFADPKIKISSATYSQLTELGFRRSGEFLYKPHCDFCQACIPVRVPVNQFVASKRQQRICRKNEDLSIAKVDCKFSKEHYRLYAKYIQARHRDGDMYPPSAEQYKSFLFSEWGNTFFLEFRLEGKLIAVAVTDTLSNGFSAVYSFYDVNFSSRSLGVYSVLSQIAFARNEQLDYLYLGYWIDQSTKMSYKKEFQPFEIYRNKQWNLADPKTLDGEAAA